MKNPFWKSLSECKQLIESLFHGKPALVIYFRSAASRGHNWALCSRSVAGEQQWIHSKAPKALWCGGPKAGCQLLSLSDFPGCDQPFMCFLFSCCQGSVQCLWEQGSFLCPEGNSASCRVHGISPTLQAWPETKSLLFAARERSFAGNSKWGAQFQFLLVTYSKWSQFVPEFVGFVNAHCHNCSPCSPKRHNTRTELICLCWMFLFHCVLLCTLVCLWVLCCPEKRLRNSLLFPGLSTRSCDMIGNLFLLRHNLGHHHKSSRLNKYWLTNSSWLLIPHVPGDISQCEVN